MECRRTYLWVDTSIGGAAIFRYRPITTVRIVILVFRMALQTTTVGRTGSCFGVGNTARGTSRSANVIAFTTAATVAGVIEAANRPIIQIAILVIRKKTLASIECVGSFIRSV